MSLKVKIKVGDLYPRYMSDFYLELPENVNEFDKVLYEKLQTERVELRKKEKLDIVDFGLYN